MTGAPDELAGPVPPRARILLLGGTAEARAVAAEVVVVSSLAGRVADPRLPVGEVRIGGFGGVEGLKDWLQHHDILAVVDATHPFARRITAHAVTACADLGIPLLRLERPGGEVAEGWHLVDSLADAAALVPTLGSRAMITTGRQGLGAFTDLPVWALVRCVDPPDTALPRDHELLLARGPYEMDAELELMRAHRIDVLVTKDSGGPLTVGKLQAAGRLGIPVVVVRRPPAAEVETVTTVAESVAWVRARS